MYPYDRLDSDLAQTVCHTTDCLREGVVDRNEWERIMLNAVATYECKLRDLVAGRKATTGDAQRLGYSSGPSV